jgi:hypothetical protein
VRDRNAVDQVELLVELITTHPLEIIMALIEKLLFQELARIVECSRVAGRMRLKNSIRAA